MQTALSKDRPNILVILTDDQGWADIGYNNPAVYTPNMDKLARGGVVFTNHYVMSQCTPACRPDDRAILADSVPMPLQPAPNPLPKGTPTMASMLQLQDTILVYPKWHLGSSPDHGPNFFGLIKLWLSLWSRRKLQPRLP